MALATQGQVLHKLDLADVQPLRKDHSDHARLEDGTLKAREDMLHGRAQIRTVCLIQSVCFRSHSVQFCSLHLSPNLKVRHRVLAGNLGGLKGAWGTQSDAESLRPVEGRRAILEGKRGRTSRTSLIN